MHRVVVTGANKGIGLAIVKRLLKTEPTAFVFLGARDASRGQDAAKALVDENAAFSGRVEALPIDVSSDDSVKHAAEAVRARFSDSATPLTALVNNAGIMNFEFTPSAFEQCIDVNFRGVVRATDAFLPLLDPSKGRVVSISSSAGPSFVEKCSAERRTLLVDPSITLPQIMGFVEEIMSIADKGASDVAAAFEEAGLKGAGDQAGYGLSKALVNMYTMCVAREKPSMLVNSVSPGLIKTELASSFLSKMPKTLDEMGAKPPSEGAKAPVFLAVGSPPGSGWYYGSDGLRSPLDRYRSPGSPAYEGE